MLTINEKIADLRVVSATRYQTEYLKEVVDGSADNLIPTTRTR